MKAPVPDLECIAEPRRAAVLLDPLRLRILAQAGTPASATEIAARLRLPRQRVNYHVRALHRARLLHRAGRFRKRNFLEQRYQATARAYLLSPETLGPLAADPRRVPDALSAAYLLSLASLVQRELSQAFTEASARGKRLATLSVQSEIRFENPVQRERFTRALEQAVVDVIGRFTSPYRLPDGSDGPGRPYRLMVGCYPIPPGQEKATP